MKFNDEQITLSMKTIFVRDNNAIKMTMIYEVHPILTTSSEVCSISLILSQKSSKNSQIEELEKKYGLCV